MSMMGRVSAGVLLAATALIGCAPGERLNPLPVDAGFTDAGGGGSGGGGPADAGPSRRTVMQRNPFGDVAETENLLWDGDFEWYSVFSDQYGWLAGSSMGMLDFTFSDIRLGAACRSGIKCAGLKKHRIIAGIAVASQGNKLEVSFWAHLSEGSCDQIVGQLMSFGEGADPNVTIAPVSADPDPDGWCQYDAVVDPRTAKPALVISNESDGDAIIDDAVLKKVSASRSVKAYHGPPSPERVAEREAAQEAFRRLRGPHDPPPNEARRAFQQWRRR